MNSSNTVSAPNIVLALAVPCLPLVHLSVVPTLGTGKTTTKRLEGLLYNIDFFTAICHSLHTNACKVQQHFCTFLASREYWYSLLLKERCMSKEKEVLSKCDRYIQLVKMLLLGYTRQRTSTPISAISVHHPPWGSNPRPLA